MADFGVVSIDMFRTLADVDDLLKRERWQVLLSENYTPDLALKCQTHLDSSWHKRFPRDRFALQKEILCLCFEELFSKIPCKFSPSEATALTIRQHTLSKPFNDALAFLPQVGKQYPICLATDADEDLLGELRNMYAFDSIFTSEQLRTYKGYADGRFFSAVIDHYGLRAEQIIHIGDERDEIIGAHMAGITTCWLNRKDKTWSVREVKPDYEVKSLVEAATILSVNLISDNLNQKSEPAN